MWWKSSLFFTLLWINCFYVNFAKKSKIAPLSPHPLLPRRRRKISAYKNSTGFLVLVVFFLLSNFRLRILKSFYAFLFFYFSHSIGICLFIYPLEFPIQIEPCTQPSSLEFSVDFHIFCM